MLEQNRYADIVQPLIDTGNNFLEEMDTSKAEMLLYNLPKFEKLPKTTLKFIINYLVKSIEPAGINMALTRGISILEQLKGRKDYLEPDDKIELKKLAQQLEDDKLIELSQEL